MESFVVVALILQKPLAYDYQVKAHKHMWLRLTCFCIVFSHFTQ